MKKFRNHSIFVIICLLTISLSVNARDQKIDFTSHWDSVRVLKNPYKGWYHHLLDNGISQYAIKNDSLFASFPGMDHIYLRLAWSYLEPEEGKFDWHYIDDVVDKYVPAGYKISFRISCSETGRYPNSVGEQVDGVQYATPSWIRNAGAKGVVCDRGNGRIKSWVPEWGDPVFLDKLNQFHKAFADRYDGKPWVRYVDIGSIGDWGEGHTSSSTNVTPTVSEVKANVDLYLKNYKKSQLVATDDLLWWNKSDEDRNTLYKYVTGKGITLRDDSPLVNWYVQQFLPAWTLIHPEFYSPLYLKSPIILEMEHYRIVKNNGNWVGKNGENTIRDLKVSGADMLRGAMKTMHATYIGYHGLVEDWFTENPDLSGELANRCGYWYFPVRATVPAKMTRGENFVSMEWLNKGVAPAYNVFSLILHFEATSPENTFDLIIENSGNKNWQPDKIQIEKYLLMIPSKAAKGKYKLSFKLVDQSGEKDQVIQLGLKEKSINNEGYIYLGKVSV